MTLSDHLRRANRFRLALLGSVLYELVASLLAVALLGKFVSIHDPDAAGGLAVAISTLLLAPSSLIVVFLLFTSFDAIEPVLAIGAIINIAILTFISYRYVWPVLLRPESK
jgi:hypothetical protein